MAKTEEEEHNENDDPAEGVLNIEQASMVDEGLEVAPRISYHALTRKLVPSNLKIVSMINGHEVVVLINRGSTNNFI